jgi:hypothetical protein
VTAANAGPAAALIVAAYLILFVAGSALLVRRRDVA